MKVTKYVLTTVHLPHGMLKDLELLVELKGYRSRAEAVRQAIRMLLRDELYVNPREYSYNPTKIACDLMDKIVELASRQVSRRYTYPLKAIYPDYFLIKHKARLMRYNAMLIQLAVHVLRELGFRLMKKTSARSSTRTWHIIIDVEDFYDEQNP